MRRERRRGEERDTWRTHPRKNDRFVIIRHPQRGLLDSPPAIATEVPMRLIGLAVTLTFSLTLAPLAVEAQRPTKVPRIGLLGGGSASTNAARTDAFRQGLRELGYVEGKNIVIEELWAEGKADRLPALVAEL